ncbi:MAG: 5-oxoprolinase subunit PxpB [Xanthobacteraceae bacterium]|nr:5-oxoprolinase subunit PxpB [Xanthobacteraceae bacterium]
MEFESSPRYLPNGDTGLTVEFGSVIDDAVNRRVLALDCALQKNPIKGIIETVPTYRSLLVHYDPAAIGFNALCDLIRPIVARPSSNEPVTRRWRVPVVYGGAFGIDLDGVARAHELTTAELIARHTGADYRVAMLGFTPGFAYLSGLSSSLATPRRPSPRGLTPKGTISIGGHQAGIQCLAGPSGWHLLGQTPVRTFHPSRDPMFLLEPGDGVTFVEISPVEFERFDRMAERGERVAELIAA